jgi:hypothetical protein
MNSPDRSREFQCTGGAKDNRLGPTGSKSTVLYEPPTRRRRELLYVRMHGLSYYGLRAGAARKDFSKKIGRATAGTNK